MTLNEYQERAQDTAIYASDRDDMGRLTYAALGLCGESGETAEKIKKILRGDPNPEYLRKSLVDELGDVLWYVSALATECGISLESVANINLTKLAARKKLGTIKGSGDER